MPKPLTAIVLCALLLAGCATTVPRATPTELRAAPGSSAMFVTLKPFDTAYRKTLEQMKSCYERKLGLFGSAQTVVVADKSANEAQVSLAFSSMLSYRVFVTIVLTPTPAGTTVAAYYAGEKPAPGIDAALRNWLNTDAFGCPGDDGFSDRLDKP